MSARLPEESFEQYKARLKYEKIIEKQTLKGRRVLHISTEKNRERDRDDENSQSNFIKVHAQINDIFEFVSKLGVTTKKYEEQKTEYFKKKSTLTVRDMRRMRDSLVDAIKPALPIKDVV